MRIGLQPEIVSDAIDITIADHQVYAVAVSVAVAVAVGSGDGVTVGVGVGVGVCALVGGAENGNAQEQCYSTQ